MAYYFDVRWFVIIILPSLLCIARFRMVTSLNSKYDGEMIDSKLVPHLALKTSCHAFQERQDFRCKLPLDGFQPNHF